MWSRRLFSASYKEIILPQQSEQHRNIQKTLPTSPLIWQQTMERLFNVKVGQTIYPMPDYIDLPSVSYLPDPKGHIGPPTATIDRKYF
jgi:hypothetical protein